MGRLDWLGKLAAEIVIPAGVAGEVENGPAEDSARRWLQTEGATHVHVVHQIDNDILVWDLGRGESEVLAW
ncbi:MAG: DUF3368 domain-containing protein, partial [Planctomycetota bacterium]|nr:DUF3368 domain-containing protein [Planctomycetota bacterium]